MIILGIDPGTATSGYGVINVLKNETKVIDWGLIETDKSNDQAQRLLVIYQKLLKIIKLHSPDIISIEKIFFAANAKTAISVGQAQGVMFYCAAKTKTKMVEYAPGTIKKIVSGSGRASKKEMQTAIRKIFGAKVRSEKKKRTHFDNAADALAVAYCHASKTQFKY